MINIDKIITILEKFAPLELAEEWDNSGWQINLGNEKAKKIMICLSVTSNVIEQAIKNDCDLIVSHHPLIFKGIKKLETDKITNKLVADCIKNNIQVYAAHTNLDKTKGGINDILCEVIGAKVISLCGDYVRIAKFTKAIPLDDLILKLKISLNTSKIKIINPENIDKIKTIAVCSGSGAEFLEDVNGVDAFITGDVKYHTALEVQNVVLIDAGHFATERIILPVLKNLLEKEAKDIFIARESEPWVIA